MSKFITLTHMSKSARYTSDNKTLVDTFREIGEITININKIVFFKPMNVTADGMVTCTFINYGKNYIYVKEVYEEVQKRIETAQTRG